MKILLATTQNNNIELLFETVSKELIVRDNKASFKAIHFSLARILKTLIGSGVNLAEFL